jgi:hypothetical protein
MRSRSCLDALLKEHIATLDRQTGHIKHLERWSPSARHHRRHEPTPPGLDAVREERDRQLAELKQTNAGFESRIAALDAEQNQLHAALRTAQVTVTYRQSARWWVKLPWFRVKLWLTRAR